MLMRGLQRYVSDELTHFVGRSMLNDLEAQYALLLKIITGGLLTHPPHDEHAKATVSIKLDANVSVNDRFSPSVVCFCDIPVADLELHSSKYGRFALCFKKSFLSGNGANPVFYIAANSRIPVPLDVDINPVPKTLNTATRGKYFDEMVGNQILCSMAHLQSVKCGPNPDRVIAVARASRFLTFYVYSFMKTFNESLEEDHSDNYYMEREWRVLGNVRFSLEDISRVILPEKFAKRFRADVPEFYRQVTFI
jgi:hypothetical protein